MRKQKIYLDTSVISHLYAPDTPEKMADTLQLWGQIQSGEYDVVLSQVVFDELEKCIEPKKGYLISFLDEITYTLIEPDRDAVALAKKFIGFGVLTEKNFNDCRHIAAALVTGCDIIVSWNFKHIVNTKTINGTKAIAALEGLRDILIYPPTMLVGGDYYDE